ncbi:PARP-domain-containing protein [Dacryopinax primogenitus]|uniref:Poly [ADP-ribose] polymerase n=1 Tax=Dacryopinax primogenitus (strain DJM 731) TaxID=1858805 RepID=M5FZ57_DACPD|nr:PARP-domain-containing protein [Dacryopinax primogenitus]EJU01160.1 PARP-domain-containing protein [Dacryopinax primogenitus]
MARKATAAPAPSTRTTRSSTATSNRDGTTSTSQTGDKHALDDAKEDDDDVKAPPAKKSRGAAKKTAKVDVVKTIPVKTTDNDDVAMDGAADGVVKDDDGKPKGKAKAKGKGKVKEKQAAKPDVAEDDEGAKDDAKDNVGDVDDGTEPKANEPPAKMKTVVKRGKAPVDPESSYVNTHQVYVDGADEVYDGMLMQTNIGVNANKFYSLQLLHPVTNTSTILLHTRWGRVGEKGAAQDKGPYPPALAVVEFKKQFRSKTGFAWESRKTFTAKQEKYGFVERDFEAQEEEEEKADDKTKGKKVTKQEVKIPDSAIHVELQNLMKLIFNTSYMNATLSSFSYDQNKAPLGKMSKATLLKGFGELKKISEAIANPTSQEVLNSGGLRNACAQYSNQYYTYIPHVFGRNPPTIIDNQVLLQRELDLIDALGDMEVASKLLSDSISQTEDGTLIHPLDAQLASLELKNIAPLTKDSTEFEAVAKYARETHGTTHHFGAEVVDVFRVERHGEKEAWEAAGWDKLADGDKMLLWHGSRATNFGGILKQGLRIAPPEAPVSGYMFGKGVYFADMMSKSAGYCHSYLSDRTGLLLLCEVAAKPFLELTHADYNAEDKCAAAKGLATKGLGRMAPDVWVDAGANTGWDELNGTVMPGGPGKDLNLATVFLHYNEYIVYQPHQIRLRYLLRCKIG